MGNINNIWYIKGSGGSWADTKCELDDCYSNPYVLGDNLILRANIPGGYTNGPLWLCDMDGNRLESITADRYDSALHQAVYTVPPTMGMCLATSQEGCIGRIDTESYGSDIADRVNEYVNGLNNTQIYFVDNATNTNYYPDLGQLPPGFTRIDQLSFAVPCDILEFHPPGYTGYGLVFLSTGPLANHTYNFPRVVESGSVGTGPALKCFYFEIPLMKSGVETAALASEPFHCPECKPTLVLSSDYCLNTRDIFGEQSFLPQPGTQNDWRIQAVMKTLPSTISFNRNTRCNNFKSKIQERFKLQGAWTDFPDYMVRIIESIFSGKVFGIDGETYTPDADQVFTERNVAGRSMKRLDVQLIKCETGMVFPCACVVDCETDLPTAGFNIVKASEILPDIPPSGDYNGLDRTFYRAQVTGITGPYPPYTVSAWVDGGGATDHNDDIEAFSDTRTYNYFRRKSDHMGFEAAGLQLSVGVTDARGCTKRFGLGVDLEDMRCAGFGASFSASNVTPSFTGRIIVSGISVPFTSYDVWVTADLSAPAYATGVVTDPYIITGLTPGQGYAVVLKVYCEAGVHGFIGPYFINAS